MSTATVFKICPTCFKVRPYNEGCQTAECKAFQNSPAFLRDEVVVRLNIARLMKAMGNTLEDWDKAIQELELEHMKYSAGRSAEAFTQ